MNKRILTTEQMLAAWKGHQEAEFDLSITLAKTETALAAANERADEWEKEAGEWSDHLTNREEELGGKLQAATQRAETVKAQAAVLHRELSETQWIIYTIDGEETRLCPACGGREFAEGHSSDCTIAKALATDAGAALLAVVEAAREWQEASVAYTEAHDDDCEVGWAEKMTAAHWRYDASCDNLKAALDKLDERKA